MENNIIIRKKIHNNNLKKKSFNFQAFLDSIGKPYKIKKPFYIPGPRIEPGPNIIINKKESFNLPPELLERLYKCIYSNSYTNNLTTQIWHISEKISLIHSFGTISYEKSYTDYNRTNIYEIYEWTFNKISIKTQSQLIEILYNNINQIENTFNSMSNSQILFNKVNNTIINNYGQFQYFDEIGWYFKNAFKIYINKIQYQIFLTNIKTNETKIINEQQLFQFITQNQNQIQELLNLYQSEYQDLKDQYKLTQSLKEIKLDNFDKSNIQIDPRGNKQCVAHCESIFIKKPLTDRYRYQACKELICNNNILNEINDDKLALKKK